MITSEEASDIVHPLGCFGHCVMASGEAGSLRDENRAVEDVAEEARSTVPNVSRLTQCGASEYKTVLSTAVERYAMCRDIRF